MNRLRQAQRKEFARSYAEEKRKLHIKQDKAFNAAMKKLKKQEVKQNVVKINGSVSSTGNN